MVVADFNIFCLNQKKKKIFMDAHISIDSFKSKNISKFYATLYMKYDMCMKRECKNCFKQLECFKKEGKKNEFRKAKNRGFENSNIQSQKRIKQKRQRISKDKK